MDEAPTAHPTQVVARVAAGDADLVSGLLWLDDPLGIEERGEGAEVVLVAGFASRDAAAAAADRLAGQVGAVELRDVVDECWRDAWRPWARPVRVGSLVVVPVGPDDEHPTADVAGEAATVLAIDAGRAFTAGSHPTTRLMLAEIERALAAEDAASVLDVGCGSGVLSVAAARLGARQVTAIDVDPAAIEATTTNARRNGVADSVAVSDMPLADVPGRFDLVLANMLASTIVELADSLTAHVAPGGRLVLSGLLAEQWVATVFHLDRWYVEAVTSEDGWVAVRLSR